MPTPAKNVHACIDIRGSTVRAAITKPRSRKKIRSAGTAKRSNRACEVGLKQAACFFSRKQAEARWYPTVEHAEGDNAGP